MNIKDGEKLIKTARASIYSVKINFEFSEKRGVFVTIYSYPKKSLRGCIGFIEGVFGLSEGVYKAAKEAAFSDTRFEPIDINKEDFIVEVSILTKPRILKENFLEKIRIGKDGLIIEKGYNKGVLLPKVAVEYKLNSREFLECCCNKAGLGKEEWKDKDCRIYTFQTCVFSEEKPNGKVRKLNF